MRGEEDILQKRIYSGKEIKSTKGAGECSTKTKPVHEGVTKVLKGMGISILK